MNRRGTPVDFGPLSLPVGDMPMFQAFGNAEASLEDVMKLHQLLSGQPRDQQGDDAHPLELSSVVFQGDAPHHTQILTTLAELLPKLSTSATFKTHQRAEIQLSSEILADTQLLVMDAGSRIEFYFHISNDETRNWLQEHLPWLAKTVGERLERDVRIALSGARGSGLGELIEDWYYGMEA